MKDRTRNLIYIFSVLLSLVIASCEAPAPNKLDTGSEPYQKPYVPQHVTATRGEKDSITLSWDIVDGADLYIIEGIPSSLFGDGEMEEYARTTDTSYTFLLNGSGDGTSYRDFNADESYIFTVKAYVNFGSASDYLISDSSDYAEGCFAPATLEFHTSITFSSINFYWNLSNIYSTLSTGDKPTPLYIPSFVIEYRMKGETEWKTITKEDVGGEDPWMYASLPVSGNDKYQFVHNEEYEFRITMTLSEGVVTPSTLQSGIFTTRISDDLSVSSVAELEASEGTLSDSIEVSWKIPTWSLPANRANSYFAIYRSEDGGDEIALVDEIASLEHDERIKEENSTIIFTDTDVERGKTYSYRVVNAAIDLDGQLHEEEKDDASVVEGHVYNPEVTGINATFTSSDNATATVDISFSYSPELPEDLSFAIERTVWHSTLDKTVVDYKEIPTGGSSIEIKEDIADCKLNSCAAKRHNYSYALVILKDGEYFYTVESLDGASGAIGELGDMSFTDFTASNDYVDAINISWKVREDISVSNWSYSIDNGEYKTFTPVKGSDGMYSYIIGIDDDDEHSIMLKADSYTSPEARIGKRLSLADFALSASDGESADDVVITWAGKESVSDDVVYMLYADDEPLAAVDSRTGIYVASGLLNDGTVYSFSIQAYNTTQHGTPRESSGADTGYVLPVPEILSVSKGEYSDRVVIEWNADKLKDLVDGFEVIRSSSNSVDEEGFLDSSISSDVSSFEDRAVPSRESDYFYFVRSVKGGVKSHASNSSEKIPNVLFEEEAANCGYLFNTALEDITVDESVESNNKYISDYFVVTVPAQKTIREYVLSAEDGVVEHYNMSDLKESSEARIYTNGKDSDVAGYFAYDDINGTMTFNSSCGLVSSNDFTVSGISVQGFGGKDTDLPTNESGATGSYRRGFNAYDYIKLFAVAFNDALSNSKPKSSDWWNLSADQNDFPNGVFTGICTGSVSIGFAQYKPENPGYIYFNNYNFDGRIYLNSNNDDQIKVMSRNGGAGGALEHTPLRSIGEDSDNNKTVMSFPDSFVVNGTVVKYKNADVTVKNVIVEEGASDQGYGSYSFVREDESTMSVEINANNIGLVPVKP